MKGMSDDKYFMEYGFCCMLTWPAGVAYLLTFCLACR